MRGVINAYMESLSTGPVRRIVVQRKAVWKSTSAFWMLPMIQGRHGLLLCKFAGELDNAEPSADQVGPRREFFDLLKTSMVRDSGLFSTGKSVKFRLAVSIKLCGPPQSCVPEFWLLML